MRKSLLVIFFLVLLVGCSANKQENKEDVQEQETTASPREYEVLAEKLKVPWSIAKAGNTFYISERTGNIVKVSDGKQIRQKVVLKKQLAKAAEAGLLGFVLSPNFETNQSAFAYYTYVDSSGQFNRIVELQLIRNEWQEGKLLLDKIPSGPVHHGGRLKLGPDGKLFATAGDASKPELSQTLNSLGGKILRLNLDGSIPLDNPFKNSYVYSYGHRNPQGLAWALDGTLYESEHGQSAYDEINIIKAGANYGWPVIQGDEKKAGMKTPFVHSGADMTWAPSGMAFHDGMIYVATLRGNAVRVFDAKTGETREVVTDVGRIRDVYIDNNDLYFVSNNTDGRGTPDEKDDKLYRVPLQGL